MIVSPTEQILSVSLGLRQMLSQTPAFAFVYPLSYTQENQPAFSTRS